MPDYFQVLLMFSITVLVLYIFNLGMLFNLNSFYWIISDRLVSGNSLLFSVDPDFFSGFFFPIA